MGRPRKNPLPAETKSDQTETKQAESETKPDPAETFRAALNDLITADPEAANKILAAVLGVAEGKMRTVEPERRKKVEIPREEPNIPPPPPPKPGVVFASKHLGYRFGFGGGAKYDALGNKEIIPPTVVDFAPAGMARVTNLDTVARMRAYIDKMRANHREPEFVEIRDEIAQEAEAGRQVTAVASQRVTVATPLAELVTA
jgi:hypothetical protein